MYLKVCFTAILCLVNSPCLLAQVVQDWHVRNQFLQVNSGKYTQEYIEADTQNVTSNGVLDSEVGVIQQVGIGLRWQTHTGVFTQLEASRQTGDTRYDGYLQLSNGALQPYRAITGNVQEQISAQIGYAFNGDEWPGIPARLQIVPLVYFGKTNWHRKLAQYTESYRFGATAIGALAQWQATPSTTVEFQALTGRMATAKVSAPSLGFSSTQSGGNLREWRIGFAQNLGAALNIQALNGWAITAQYANSKFHHSKSAVVNGLQAPPSQHSPVNWAIGLRKHL